MAGAVLLLSACGGAWSQQPTLEMDPPPPAEIHAAWPSCRELGAFSSREAEQPDFGRGSIPDDFSATSAVRCVFGETERTSGDGLERRATEPDELAALERYLSRPSETVAFPGRQACNAMGWYPPWLFLVDADGHWIRPQIPTDVCGFPLDLWSNASSSSRTTS